MKCLLIIITLLLFYSLHGVEAEYIPAFGVSRENDIEVSYKVFTEMEYSKFIHDGAIVIMREAKIGEDKYWNPLVSALQKMGDLPVETKSYVCTRGHVISALRKVTGCESGDMLNASDWIDWLKKNKNHIFTMCELK